MDTNESERMKSEEVKALVEEAKELFLRDEESYKGTVENHAVLCAKIVDNARKLADTLLELNEKADQLLVVGLRHKERAEKVETERSMYFRFHEEAINQRDIEVEHSKKMEAERDRLREALEKLMAEVQIILSFADGEYPNIQSGHKDLKKSYDKADKALNPEEKSE